MSINGVISTDNPNTSNGYEIQLITCNDEEQKNRFNCVQYDDFHSHLSRETKLKFFLDFVYFLDENNDITYISPSLSEYGFNVEELQGESIFELIHPDDHGKMKYGTDFDLIYADQKKMDLILLTLIKHARDEMTEGGRFWYVHEMRM